MSDAALRGSLGGFEFVFRMPTEEELQSAIATGDTKALFYKCETSHTKEELREVARKKPGIPISMGLGIFRAAGCERSSLQSIAEDEVDDQGVADALVRFAELGPLHVVRYEEPATHARITLVVREFDEAELSRALKNKTLSTKRELVRLVTVHPVGADRKLDTSEIDAKAPGLYRPIVDFLAEQAGLTDGVRLGEA